MTNIKTIQYDIYYFEIHSKIQNYSTFDVLQFLRNLNEQDQINEIEKDVEKLLNEERCFQKFCQIAKGIVNIKQDRAVFQALKEEGCMLISSQTKDQMKTTSKNYSIQLKEEIISI
ncbi:unnamed protein product [Paramecium sonneborni]|uniref:Uncharacterized protein n=1 Tax=Paramecium sonneborni TaxID=65129 RepID=A0A8S1RQ50_9CILI|nr:unnamed protein product [Paramecium sonneborni]